MNPLALLKEKLMVKPNVVERELVAVVIKGIKTPKKPDRPKTTAKDKTQEKPQEDEDENEDEPQISKLIIEETENKEEEELENKKPLIVDETAKGFDINALRKKLTESKKIKVTVKQTIQNAEEKQTTVEPIQVQPIKKAKKQKVNMPFILEEDEDEEGKEK